MLPHNQLLPAMMADGNQYLFNDSAIGAKSLVFAGGTIREVLEGLKLRGACSITIDPKAADMEDRAFRIFFKQKSMPLMGEELPILDAGKLAIDQVGKSVIGIAAAAGSAISDFPGKEWLNSGREAVQQLFEAKESRSLKEKLSAAFGSTKGKSTMAGIFVTYMGGDGLIDTHRTSISLLQLHQAFRRTIV